MFKRIKIHWPTLGQGLFWYALGEATVLFSSARLLKLSDEIKKKEAVSPATAADFFVWLIFITVVFLLLLQVVRRRWFFETLFSLALFSGTWFLLDLFLPKGTALPVALLVVVARELWRRVWLHNLVVVVGIAGVAGSLGFSLAPQAAAAILLILSVYDVVAVYVTKHMVKMFTGLLREHVVMAIILPVHPRLHLSPLEKVSPGAGFFLLGTGDLALPLLFLASTFISPPAVIASTAIGIIFGFFLTHLIFTNQSGRRPMPALPPLALGTLAGYLVGYLLV